MRPPFHFLQGILFFLIVISFSPIADASDEDDARNLMASYFEALKNGNVKALAAMLTEPLLDSKRMLLEENTAYPTYLKKYYQDASLRVVGISRTDTNMQTVIAEIFFPNDNRPLRPRFLIKHTENGWKIANESSAQ